MMTSFRSISTLRIRPQRRMCFASLGRPELDLVFGFGCFSSIFLMPSYRLMTASLSVSSSLGSSQVVKSCILCLSVPYKADRVSQFAGRYQRPSLKVTYFLRTPRLTLRKQAQCASGPWYVCDSTVLSEVFFQGYLPNSPLEPQLRVNC